MSTSKDEVGKLLDQASKLSEEAKKICEHKDTYTTSTRSSSLGMSFTNIHTKCSKCDKVLGTECI